MPHASHKECPLFAADRGAWWESLRSKGRVAQIKPVDPRRGGYYLTRRDDVVAALRHPEQFASLQNTFGSNAFDKRLRQVPQSCEPQEHARFSQELRPLFSPRVSNRSRTPYAPRRQPWSTPLRPWAPVRQPRLSWTDTAARQC